MTATRNLRQVAETEAKSDLAKSDLQVLTDLHEELMREDRPVGENLAHANKRIASIMVRTAISADRASKVIIRLTWAIAVLTVVLVGLTILLCWKG